MQQALAPDIGALQAACSAFLSECRCPLCGLPWRKASTFPCGDTFCYECAIATLEGPGISQSECPKCKGKYWKRDLKPNPQMMAVVEHTQKILGIAAPQATAAAGRGGHQSEATAAESEQRGDDDSRAGTGPGEILAAGLPPNGMPSRAEQALPWTSTAGPAAAEQAGKGMARDVGASRALPWPTGDSRLRDALARDEGAGPVVRVRPREPHLGRLLCQVADVRPSAPEAASPLQGPVLPSLATMQAALPGETAEAQQQPDQAHRAEETAAAGAMHPVHRQGGRSAAYALAAAAQPHASATLAELGMGDPGAEHGGRLAARLGAPHCNVGRGLESEQRQTAVVGPPGHSAMPNAAAAAGAGLPHTPPALQPPGLGHTLVTASGGTHSAGEAFLREAHEVRRHGDAPQGARSAPQAPPMAGASTTPFGALGGVGFAACGSHPLFTVGSAPMATPHAQLVSQPRSQAGAGWATLSNGRPVTGTGCGRQLPGSVVGIRRGTPSVNNAYLDFHTLLEHPVRCAGGPPGPRSESLSAQLAAPDAVGWANESATAACGGWVDFQEAAWLRRLAELPGPTEQEREALEFELSIVGMFLAELRGMIAALQGGSDGVAMTAAGLEACAASLLGGSGRPAEGSEAQGGEAGMGGELQQGDASDAGDGGAPPQRLGHSAVQASPPPPKQQEHQSQEEPPQWRVTDGDTSAAVAIAAVRHGACACAPGGAAVCLAAAKSEAGGSHHGAAAAGPPDNAARNEAPGGPHCNGGGERPASEGSAGGSWDHEGVHARTSAGPGALAPARRPSLRCAPDGAALGDSDEDVGRRPCCKRARTETAGSQPSPAPHVKEHGVGPLQSVAGPKEHVKDAAVAGPPPNPERRLGPPATIATQPACGVASNEREGAPPAASTLCVLDPPLALRAPSPVPCPQQEPEHEAGAEAIARRRRDRAQANKRNLSEPLLQPPEPHPLNPHQQHPQPQQLDIPQQTTTAVPAAGQRHARRAKAREHGSAAAAVASLAAGAELAAPGQASRRLKTLYVLPSNIHPEEKARLRELSRRVRGVELLGDVQPQLTHLVMNLDAKNLVAGRTIKYMRALIHGCWVVGMTWVDACLAAGRLLPEGPFEAMGDGVHLGTPALRRLRPDRADKPLFSGLRFCTANLKATLDSGFPKAELEGLLQAAGGTLVRRPPPRAAAAPVTAAAALFGAAAASDLYDTSSLCTQQLTPQPPLEENASGSPVPPGMPLVFVLMPQDTEPNGETARLCREWGFAPVKTNWIYDCISHYKLLPPEGYKLGPEPNSSTTDTS